MIIKNVNSFGVLEYSSNICRVKILVGLPTSQSAVNAQRNYLSFFYAQLYDIGGCLSLGIFALRSGFYWCFDELGKWQPFFFCKHANVKTSVIMKTKNISLETKLVQDKKTTLLEWMSKENPYFTKFMEESISNKQSLLISHAAVTFIILVCSSFSTPLGAVVCLLWFITALYQCVKAGLK